MKRCGLCLILKALEEFPVDRRNTDGRHCYCRTCDRARRSASRRRNLARSRAVARRSARRRYVIRHEEILTAQRIDYRRRRPTTVRRSTRAVEAYVPPAVGNHTAPLVPVGPFADWIRREFPGWPTRELERRLDLGQDTLNRILDGRQHVVSLHIADRAFVAADCPHLLALLYPLEEAAA